MIPVGSAAPGMGGAGLVSEKGAPKVEEVGRQKGAAEKGRKPRVKKPKAVSLTPNAIIQRPKLGQTGITCCLDRFGEEGPECFTEGSIIYINRDHPLYRRQMGNREAHTMHLARLLSQKICLMKDPKDARQAFARQSELLRDAFQDK